MLALVLLLVAGSARAFEKIEWRDFTLELAGNAEAQTRQLTNQPPAQKFPLQQDWESSNFNLGLANLSAKAEFRTARVEANWFLRYTQSPLYEDDYIAPFLINFPRKVVARDVFRLDYTRQDGGNRTESVLNRLTYELDGETSRFAVGRMFINYGSGEVFNPINPFNQPLGLVAQSNIAQGNDGMRGSFFLSDDSTLHFYLLGNKRLEDYENQITRTLWLHGEYRFGDWQLDYVAGEDQKRNKIGFQLNRIVGEGMVFFQFLETSSLLNDRPSSQLSDVLLGYDNQLTGRWHLRVEVGHQETDRLALAENPAALGERLLPYEYFVAVANAYELHPLVKAYATVIHDFKTRYVYGLGRLSWSVAKDFEWDFFVNTPLYWIEDETNLVQKSFPTELGTGLRLYF